MAASASTAPLAFTLLGAPVTLIAGWMAGLAHRLRSGTAWPGPASAARRRGRGRGAGGAWAATVGPHATTPPIMAAPAISPAIRRLRCMTANVPTRAQILAFSSCRTPAGPPLSTMNMAVRG